MGVVWPKSRTRPDNKDLGVSFVSDIVATGSSSEDRFGTGSIRRCLVNSERTNNHPRVPFPPQKYKRWPVATRFHPVVPPFRMPISSLLATLPLCSCEPESPPTGHHETFRLKVGVTWVSRPDQIPRCRAPSRKRSSTSSSTTCKMNRLRSGRVASSQGRGFPGREYIFSLV